MHGVVWHGSDIDVFLVGHCWAEKSVATPSLSEWKAPINSGLANLAGGLCVRNLLNTLLHQSSKETKMDPT